MSGSCANLVGDGVIRGVLGAVDCQTRAFAEAGYSSLTSASSGFQIALTALLAIYVALVGYRMLFAADGARLSDAPGIALKIGAVLALVTSWATFQTLVFDIAGKAPGEVAAAVAAPLQAHGGSLAADPVGGLQTAYDQLTRDAAAFGKAAGADAKAAGSPPAAAAGALSAASNVLFLTTAGVIAAATLAIGVLTAVGPVFIALFLIPATRGLFAGWVRALAAAALVPLLGWLVVVLMLSVLEPWLVTLAQQREANTLDPQTGMSVASLVFVFGAGQIALLAAAGITAFGFRLPHAAPTERRPVTPAVQPSQNVAPAQAYASRIQRLAFDLQRDRIAAAGRLDAARLSHTTRATVTTTTDERSYPSDRPGRLGDAYRRPAVERAPAGSRA
ncbi:type IV secretion system protein [Phenylobacterium sp.]|uniref:type IV secretion system protein n=1 Tax=Phenylobacterium sp. TaxID=1871053 RepID=UPI001202B8B8|nr:type IV secretion system protein [Phenylobacterium sp.]THD63428.1 MAG: type IV secretion system protein [Phenylobacterium sp.]